MFSVCVSLISMLDGRAGQATSLCEETGSLFFLRLRADAFFRLRHSFDLAALALILVSLSFGCSRVLSVKTRVWFVVWSFA
jgi:hypothetical protein